MIPRRDMIVVDERPRASSSAHARAGGRRSGTPASLSAGGSRLAAPRRRRGRRVPDGRAAGRRRTFRATERPSAVSRLGAVGVNPSAGEGGAWKTRKGCTAPIRSRSVQLLLGANDQHSLHLLGCGLNRAAGVTSSVTPPLGASPVSRSAHRGNPSATRRDAAQRPVPPLRRLITAQARQRCARASFFSPPQSGQIRFRGRVPT